MDGDPAKRNESLSAWSRLGFRLFFDKFVETAAVAEVIRYLVTGALNTLLTFLVFVAGLYVFHIHYLLALLAAFLAGTVFTFVLNFVWVFRPETDLTFHDRFVKHLLPNVGTFSLNLIALHVLVYYWGADPFLCQMVLMTLIVAVNFIFAKFWAFRR